MIYITKPRDGFPEIEWEIEKPPHISIGYDKDGNQFTGLAHIVHREIEDVNDIEIGELKTGSHLWMENEFRRILSGVLDMPDFYKDTPSMLNIAIERLCIASRHFSYNERTKTLRDVKERLKTAN